MLSLSHVCRQMQTVLSACGRGCSWLNTTSCLRLTWPAGSLRPGQDLCWQGPASRTGTAWERRMEPLSSPDCTLSWPCRRHGLVHTSSPASLPPFFPSLSPSLFPSLTPSLTPSSFSFTCLLFLHSQACTRSGPVSGCPPQPQPGIHLQEPGRGTHTQPHTQWRVEREKVTASPAHPSQQWLLPTTSSSHDLDTTLVSSISYFVCVLNMYLVSSCSQH